jgi:hypothetical protein
MELGGIVGHKFNHQFLLQNISGLNHKALSSAFFCEGIFTVNRDLSFR